MVNVITYTVTGDPVTESDSAARPHEIVIVNFHVTWKIRWRSNLHTLLPTTDMVSLRDVLHLEEPMTVC